MKSHTYHVNILYCTWPFSCLVVRRDQKLRKKKHHVAHLVFVFNGVLFTMRWINKRFSVRWSAALFALKATTQADAHSQMRRVTTAALSVSLSCTQTHMVKHTHTWTDVFTSQCSIHSHGCFSRTVYYVFNYQMKMKTARRALIRPR